MKKYIILFVLILIITAISSYIFRADLETFFACSLEKNPEGKDRCYLEHATQYGDLSRCDKIKNGYMQSNCYKTIALSTQNAYTCSIIPIEKSEPSIMRDCYIELAVIKKDVSLCQFIPTTEMSTRDYCKVRVAIETGDPNICRNLESNEYTTKEMCGKRAKESVKDIPNTK